MSREYTNLLIESINNEYTSKEDLFDIFMCYLSEDQVKQFCLTANDRELAWVLAEMKGSLCEGFNDHPELLSEWEYIKESE